MPRFPLLLLSLLLAVTVIVGGAVTGGASAAGRILSIGAPSDLRTSRMDNLTCGAPGSLDTTFDSDGKLTTEFMGSNDYAYSVAVQPDGKIVVAGYSQSGPNYGFALTRYNMDGSLDTSFDGDGKVTTNFSDTNTHAFSVAIQSDGKIVAAGDGNGFALARYNADGSLDTTFDGDGMVTTPILSFSDRARSVAVQSDGKIVVAGESYNGANLDFALARFNADGTLDTTFDGDGKVTTAVLNSSDYGYSVAIQPDGKIVVAGYSLTGSGDDFALVRYNPDGSLDTTFDGDGKVTTSFSNSSYDHANSVAIQPDGKIVVAGDTYDGSSRYFAIARYNTNGSLDSMFDGDGKVQTSIIGSDDRANSVAIQPDGRIVVAGGSWNGSKTNFALARYSTDGSLDTTFDGEGKVTTAIANSYDYASSVAIQPDGQIVAAGYSDSGLNFDFALARYDGVPCSSPTVTVTATPTLTIPTLFNTGVDGDRLPLPDGHVTDPHYWMSTSPIGSTTDIRIRRAVGGYPVGGPFWIGDDDLSAWLGPNNDPQVRGPDGIYDYNTNFDLTGVDPVSVSINGQWSMDDNGLDILLNGISLGISGPPSGGFTVWTPFSIPRGSPFVAGVNTLTFRVQNAPWDSTGLRVEMTGQAISCTGITQSNAYQDTILVSRAGPNGQTGIGDNVPLGGRTPVILVHGIHGNRQNGVDTVQSPATNLNFRELGNLVGALNGDTAYTDHFKTYSFHYVSDRHTAQEIGQALRDRIDERPEFVNKSVIIVAHSMGGIVARQYMLQPTSGGPFPCQEAGKRVEKLITLATLHHGTYGANGWARQARFDSENQETANSVFAAADDAYWGGNGCQACSRQRNTQEPNRGSLLWDNDFDNNAHFSEFLLSRLPWERHHDLPDTSAFNDRIVAYWGEMSPSSTNSLQPHSFLPVVGQRYEGVGDDRRLAIAAYLIQAVDAGSIWLVPPPQNDGLVPVESARFDGATLMGRVHCPGFNHRNMRDGDGKDLQNPNLLGTCDDGGLSLALFDSVRNKILGLSIASPSLMVGPDRAGFGSYTYNVARPLDSGPMGTIDVPLSNLGDAPLQITSLSLAGADPDQFVTVNPPTLPLTLAGKGSVHITVGFNPTSPGEKTAQLRAENSSSNSVVMVNISATGVPQECDLNLSPASQFVPMNGGSGEVMVGNISCPWTVSAVDDWIHPTALADRVSFTVDANTTTDVRYGTMIVSVYGRPYLYSISQDAKNVPCWLQMSSDQSVVQREAGGSSFYITAPNTCGWSFQSDSPWLAPSIENLNGSGSVGFTVADNVGLDRSGIITIQGAATTAQFTVHQQGASVSGTVTYGNAASPPKYVSNVLVNGTGSPNVTTTTGAPDATAGQYTLSGFGVGSYTIMPTKTGGVNNAINSFDAARIAQHVAGTSLLTGNALVAADVTGNGQIQSFDAARVAQYVAGTTQSSQTGMWKFFTVASVPFPPGTTPTSRTYASVNSNIAGEDYTGLLIGEVSGNWTNTGARETETGQPTVGDGPTRGIGVELPQITAEPGKEFIVPVSIAGAVGKEITSYEFDLRYDPSITQPLTDPVDVAKTASRGLSFVTNANEPGLLRVVMYGAYPIDKNGILLNLRFQAVGKPGSISPLTFERIMFNEGEPSVSTSDGGVELF